MATTLSGTCYIVRFNIRQRIEHIALIVVFTALAATGLLQRYYTGWFAEWAIMRMGGIETVRVIHRVFGVTFTFALLYHLVTLTYGLLVRRSRQSMLLSRRDFTDVVDALRYALGLRSGPPEFGRFNYRQKFEYWGLMFGSVIITATGLVLMFPVMVTRVLPGQFVAASVVIHGWEATLAVLTIIVWHFYEVILRPDVFPADTAIFTGKISIKRMMEEHSLEYADLEADAMGSASQFEERPDKTQEASTNVDVAPATGPDPDN